MFILAEDYSTKLLKNALPNIGHGATSTSAERGVSKGGVMGMTEHPLS